MLHVQWDWKAQPDWDEINATLEQYDEHGPQRIIPVESGTDQFAVMIAPRGTTPEQAQEAYDAL